jgi:hypothetical protein
MANKANMTAPKTTIRTAVQLKKTVRQPIAEDDDFEATFLSDVQIPKALKSAASTHFKSNSKAYTAPTFNLKPSADASKVAINRQTSDNQRSSPDHMEMLSNAHSAKDFIEQLHRTKVFLNSNLPLLDMDSKLYSTLLDQSWAIKKAFQNCDSQAFHCLTAKYKKFVPKSYARLSAVRIGRLINKREYEEGLLHLSHDTREQLEYVFLGYF